MHHKTYVMKNNLFQSTQMESVFNNKMSEILLLLLILTLYYFVVLRRGEFNVCENVSE